MVGEKCARAFKGCESLLEVDDGDPLAVIEDEFLRLGIPTLGLVPEMHTGIEQIMDCYVHCHLWVLGLPQVGRRAALR
jgi:hypothetical protein